MNKLIVLSGVPGSGKSYISLLIKEKMKSGHLYTISSDKLRNQICGSQRIFDYDPLMWKMYYELAKVYALDKDGIVLLDSTNAKREYRIGMVKPLKAYFDEIDLVIFKLDKVTVMRQNLDRDFPIPSDALEELFDTFEDVNDDDNAFFDKIYKIENKELTPVIEAIIK